MLSNCGGDGRGTVGNAYGQPNVYRLPAYVKIRVGRTENGLGTERDQGAADDGSVFDDRVLRAFSNVPRTRSRSVAHGNDNRFAENVVR